MKVRIKLERLFLTDLFQPSLLFVGKARNLSVECLEGASEGQAPTSPAKID
jgi:hypothetical protein